MVQVRICPDCSEISETAPGGICPKCLMGLGFDSQDGAASAAGSGQHRIPFVPPEPEELASRFPQLEILEFIGSGGMGAVYRARQLHLDRIVALKIVPVELASTEMFSERFAREARAMAKLTHPRIVTVFDFGEADGMPYLVMEFINGVNLRQAIGPQKLQPNQALAIIPQICDALQYAHAMGVVHRDIKPENILLDRQGNVKIADFGLAKLLGAGLAEFTLTQTRQMMGTPHYMAPEQLERPHEVDHRADIYALGVVFYELLTGELPLGRFSPPSEKAGTDIRLDEMVHKTLEKDPDRRYQQASELKTDLDGIASEPPRLSSFAMFSESQLTFGRVLKHWYRDWATDWQHRLLTLLKWAAFAAYVAIFYQLVDVTGSIHEVSGSIHESGYNYKVGSWCEIRKHPSTGFRTRFDIFDDSVGVVLMFGISMYIVYWRIRKTAAGGDKLRPIPWAHVAFWLLTASFVVVGGFFPESRHVMLLVPTWSLMAVWAAVALGIQFAVRKDDLPPREWFEQKSWISS